MFDTHPDTHAQYTIQKQQRTRITKETRLCRTQGHRQKEKTHKRSIFKSNLTLVRVAHQWNYEVPTISVSGIPRNCWVNLSGRKEKVGLGT